MVHPSHEIVSFEGYPTEFCKYCCFCKCHWMSELEEPCCMREDFDGAK